ncbi:MAG: hypothetical protein NBV65_07745 [Burkholderiaceae bacterium]|nr:hypothetical protein [Burkholderiaceae bacterium]
MRRIIALKKQSQNIKRNYRPRRVWSLPQKLHILERAEATSTLAAAREFDVDVRLVFQWRRHLKRGELEQRTWKTAGRRKQLEQQEQTEAAVAGVDVPDDDTPEDNA